MLKGNSWLNRISFHLGRNPIRDRASDFRQYIPSPYRSVLLLSADFELAWARRYGKADSPQLRMKVLAERERRNIPVLIEFSERYRIPITWLTVGHLFLKECRPENGVKHPEIPRIRPYQGPFWDFPGGDWFDQDPCTDWVKDPHWYAPDLIRRIVESGAEHEIGCHTFSHIDCRESVCSPDLLRAEISECRRVASEHRITFRSFVHPGHTIGGLDVLASEGFSNFRTDYRNVLGYPTRHGNGMWEFEQTAELAFRQEWSLAYHIRRYVEILKRAIRSRTVCVFWFHPSFHERFAEEIIPEIFEFAGDHRDVLWTTTHGEYAAWLNEVHESVSERNPRGLPRGKGADKKCLFSTDRRYPAACGGEIQ